MNWFTGIATFMIIWWLSLFIVMPIGVRGQAEENDIAHGTEPGAPTRSNMWRNVLWATGLTVFFFLLLNLILATGWLSWQNMGDALGLSRRPDEG